MADIGLVDGGVTKLLLLEALEVARSMRNLWGSLNLCIRGKSKGSLHMGHTLRPALTSLVHGKN